MKTAYFKSCALMLVMFVASYIQSSYNYDFFNNSNETVLIRAERAGWYATSFKVKPGRFVRLLINNPIACLHKYELYKESVTLYGEYPKVNTNQGAFDNWYLSNQCFDAHFQINKDRNGKFQLERNGTDGPGMISGQPELIVYL